CSSDLGIQENVVRDKEFSRAYHRGSGCGMNACFPKIRLARWIAGDFRANAFELSAPYVFQILPLRRSRSSFVQVNRNLITLPDLLAHMARRGDAIFEGDSVDGDEWHNVRSSHAGMRSEEHTSELQSRGHLVCRLL